VAFWLTGFCVMVLAGVVLPWPARIALGLLTATLGAAAIRTTFLLSGSRGVRALAWDDGRLIAFFGRSRNEASVTLAAGSFHLGRLGLLLRLRARDDLLVVFIDSGRQEAGCLRRLVRWLKWPPRRAADEAQAAS
jgi:hypothetical protein